MVSAVRCGICKGEMEFLDNGDKCLFCGEIPETFYPLRGVLNLDTEETVGLLEMKQLFLNNLEGDSNWDSTWYPVLCKIEARLRNYTNAMEYAQKWLIAEQNPDFYNDNEVHNNPNFSYPSIGDMIESYPHERFGEAYCFAIMGQLCQHEAECTFNFAKFNEAEEFFIKSQKLSSMIDYELGIQISKVLIENLTISRTKFEE